VNAPIVSQRLLSSFLSERLKDFCMKDCMIAVYMLDPANFVTWNNGITYQLPWDNLSDDEMNRFTDEVERLEVELALEYLQMVNSQGRAFKNRLDQLHGRKYVAVICAGAAEVCAIRAPVHRRGLWTSALASVFPESWL
jgi:hypothetical protein